MLRSFPKTASYTYNKVFISKIVLYTSFTTSDFFGLDLGRKVTELIKVEHEFTHDISNGVIKKLEEISAVINFICFVLTPVFKGAIGVHNERYSTRKYFRGYGK